MSAILENRRTRATLAATLALSVALLGSMSGATYAADVSPTKALEGEATGLAVPFDVAVDSTGRLYATNSQAASVTVYARNWAGGNTAPVKALGGPQDQTLLNGPVGIAFDSANRMYVANQFGGINVYAADWADGATAPVKVLDTPGLGRPIFIAFDSIGRLHATFLTAEGTSLVAAFARDWMSSSPETVIAAEPVKVLSGPSTGLGAQTLGIAFDASDQMYVVTSGASFEDRVSAVNMYAADWATGDTAPVKRLEGDQTGLGSQAIDVAIDYLGRTNVSNGDGSSVTIYPADWASGNTRPLTSIAGPLSGIEYPLGLAFDDGGNMYVSNISPVENRSSVLVYAPNKSVTIAGTRPQSTKLVITGKTSGIRIGSTVTPYLKVVARGQKFKALKPVKVTGKDLARGTFRVEVTNANPKKNYQLYVIVDGIRTRTVTLAKRS